VNPKALGENPLENRQKRGFMSIKLAPLTIVLLLVLTACAQKQPMDAPDWALAVQTAETREAHQDLAEQHEQVASKLLAQADEERSMLNKYIANPHKYGKRIQDLKAHAQREIGDLELAAKESRQLAEYHRQLASEAIR
jgi:predicted small lipoprotein YifL